MFHEMKCVICHGEDIQLQDVKEELAFGQDVIQVRIKVLVCQSCSERYYDRRTMQYLEEAERQLKTGQANLREIGKILVLD